MKELKNGEIYSGFLLTEQHELKDIDSFGYLFEHQKSGARLYYVKNEDNNKVFFVSFKTPPDNDCGTAHILEHSVLCGSKKYQAKDPFNELAKGSLNTYLNALTYQDKTMYPVASCNDKDFQNLMDVYLDAVFYPLIYNRKEIFMQEGWHYELKDKNSPLKINGVVYNEMKGALSDPERILNQCISKSLFPDSIYRFESGGNPQSIPRLSYEDFISFHKKYYHPSNSYFYLYGDMDILSQLNYLDKNVLSNFDKIEIKNEIVVTKDFDEPVVLEDTYCVLKEEYNGIYLAYSAVTGLSTNPLLALSFDLLSYILLDTNASPLKKALLDLGIGEEIEGWFDSSSLEMVFSIIAKKCKKEHTENFAQVIQSILKEIVTKGIDKELIKSSLSIWEFQMREQDYGYRPKGLAYGMKLMKSWLHGGKPNDYLKHWEYFEKIRSLAYEGYFEGLIQSFLIENRHCSVVTLRPDKNKQALTEKNLTDELDIKKKRLTDSQIEEIMNENKTLAAYQNEPDSIEIMKQIPVLDASEISEEIDFDESRVIEEQEFKIIYTPLASNGITYLQLQFDGKKVPEYLIPYVGLLSEVLGKIGTNQFSYHKLSNEINLNTGGLALGCNIYSKENRDYEPRLVLSTKFLTRDIKNVRKLAQEILFCSQYFDFDRLKSIIKESKAKKESQLTGSAHMAAAQRCLSFYYEGAAYKDLSSGIGFFRFLDEIDKSFDEKKEEIAENLSAVASWLLTKENFTAGIAMEESAFDACKKELCDFSSNLFEKKGSPLNYSLLHGTKREGILFPSEVQYNVKASDFRKLGFVYSGKMQVLKTIINLEYLWNKVRVQGGAYGSGFVLNRNGNFYLYSYRDPNIKSTLNSFNQTCDFLKKLDLSEREINKYKIGALSAIDRPKTLSEKADIALTRAICDIPIEKVRLERMELLETTLQDVKGFAELLESGMKENYICVIGNETKIMKNDKIFEKIAYLNGKEKQMLHKA